jgi:arylsulfatase A-like enzyme
MKKLTFTIFSFLVAAFTLRAADKPNFIYILCDDLGYGDVKCLNPNGKIATPHMDAIASRGMMFTDAHSSSAVCSPTRYGVITGRYNWRSRLQSGVLGGLSPRLIESGRMTVASFLKSQGYATACIGKWHLGMDWVKLPGKDVSELSIETVDQVHNVDYGKPISNGPTSVGFDSYFGISASLDMVPYCFIENDHVTALPTENMKLVMNKGGPVSYTREGPGAPGFTGESVLPAITKRAVETIAKQAADAKAGKPFFIYLPLNAPHTPILPTQEWRGRSGLNLYADYVMETDDAVGQITAALEKNGIAENTLLIMTSDNGCSPSADFPTLLAKGHNPSGDFRGNKADIYDGGHHIPFLVQWPAVVKAGGKYDHYVCLTDFMATCAEVLGAKLPDNAAEDSVSILPALKGQTDKPLRDAIVHHSITGAFAIREGNWKLCLAPGSAGWSDPRPGTESKDAPRIQLFDMSDDIGERTNVEAQHPDIVAKLTKILEKEVADGRSTPGTPQPNTVTPDIQSGTKPVVPKGKGKGKGKGVPNVNPSAKAKAE